MSKINVVQLTVTQDGLYDLLNDKGRVWQEHREDKEELQ